MTLKNILDETYEQLHRHKLVSTQYEFSRKWLATLDRGEIIGEMSLIDNAPRMASARALSDLEMSIISRKSLQKRLDRLEESDRVLRRLIAVLVSRIRGQSQSPE